MRHEDETPLGPQIIDDDRTSLGIQMVGRFVDERENIILQKQERQKHLGAFTVRKRLERTSQDLLRALKTGELALQSPERPVRT
ncbi:hypothetical protein, partial [uncultured Fretibacterium sp.]|uniref:hypothetical protein n=1 Tax=uncultured Fretibacterium sp. TaxID=1678694 RepID=UPI0026120D7E